MGFGFDLWSREVGAEGGSWRMLRETPATLLGANGNLPATCP